MTSRTVALQASLSMGFSRQEYWGGLPFPSPGDLPKLGIEPGLLHFRQILHCLSHQGRPDLPSTCPKTDTVFAFIIIWRRNKVILLYWMSNILRGSESNRTLFWIKTSRKASQESDSWSETWWVSRISIDKEVCSPSLDWEKVQSRPREWRAKG